MAEPVRFRACVRAFTVPETGGSDAIGRMEMDFGLLLYEAMADEVASLDAPSVLRAIGGVWFAALIAWAADRRDVGYVRDELRSVVRLTLID